MITRPAVAFLILSLSLAAQAVNGQKLQQRLDSLLNVAHSHSADTLGVLAFAELCYEYRFINQDSALLFGKAGIDLGEKLHFKTGLAQVYSDAAFVYFDKGDYNNAISFWSSSLKIRNELKDSARIASLQMKLGGAYFKMGNYEKSLRYQLEALRTYETLNIPQGTAQALNNVAAVYEHQNHLDKALEYYQKTFSIHDKSGNQREKGMTLINIGNIYFRQKIYGKAKSFYAEALKSFPVESEPVRHYRAICLNNISEILTLENKYDSALMYSEQALKLREKIGDYQGIVSSLNMIGRINGKLHKFNDAEKYLLAALDSSGKKSLLPEEGKIHLNLYELYKEKSEWKKSLESFVNYAGIKDSLMNESGRKEIAELQVKYETEKKEQHIALQEAALSQKQTRIERDYIVIIGLLLTVALSAIIFVLLRNRQARKEEMIRKENEISVREAYISASIQSQESERKRFARDLHDGMGQWISSLRLALADINNASTDEEKLRILGKSDKIMEEMNREFRSIAFNLMPHTLIQFGLKPALDEMALRLNSTGKIHVSAAAFNFPERLRELEEISLYRVIQEWTNNILKYAEATEVSIQLTGHEDENIIMIEDNGKGFDVSTLQKGAGNGWKNIQSRMNLIKGSVEIDSSPLGSGTTFTISLPVYKGVAAPATNSIGEIIS
jgi:two-component system, NarL family, sensor kinase